MGELLRAVQGQPNILDAFLRAQEYQRQIGQQEQNMRLQLAQQALARMYRQQELDYQNQRLAMERANYASEDAWRKARAQREGIAAAAKAYGESLAPNPNYHEPNPVIGPPQELTPEQQSLLVGANPDDIANAYGIPPETFRQIAQGVLQQSAQAWKDQQAKAQAAAQKAAEEEAYKQAMLGISQGHLDVSRQDLDFKKQQAARTAIRVGQDAQGNPVWARYNDETGRMEIVPEEGGVTPKSKPTASTVDYGEGGKQFEKMLAQAQAAYQNAGSGETRDSVLANYPDEIRALVPQDTNPGFRYQMKQQFVKKYFNKTGGAPPPPANAPQPQPQASAPTQGKPLTPEAIKQYAAMGLTKEQAMAQARRDGYVW